MAASFEQRVKLGHIAALGLIVAPAIHAWTAPPSHINALLAHCMIQRNLKRLAMLNHTSSTEVE